MKRFFKFLWTAVKWSFIALLLFVLSLFFREQRIPVALADRIIDACAPTGMVVRVDALSFGIRHGIHLRNFKLYDRTSARPLEPVASVESLSILPLQSRVVASGAVYSRLPESYYAPGNMERNAPVDVKLPDLEGFPFFFSSNFVLELEKPDILSLRPQRVIADIEVATNRISVKRMRLEWPDMDEPMSIEGSCTVDFAAQKIEGRVMGTAKQRHIRPFIEALDLPSALPYIDAFTDVPGKVPAACSWTVNLVNNDFDMDLDLSPNLGKYNLVPMRKAEGRISLHVYTRGTSLNYSHKIGPITAKGVKDEPLEGVVTVEGLNGTNTVGVSAKSMLPVAALLRIGGFTGEYVGEDVVGKSSCDLKFRFPRAMTNNYEVLNGKGHVRISDGQVMRMKGFKGLLALLADKVPGFSVLTDSTQASCDYTIENGVVKSDNIYIEGSVFSIKMYGSFDAVKDRLNFNVRVQFTKKDSIAGKILHPLTWPFTKLLLEFHLAGSAENPEWEYISVIDRMVEAVK